MSIQCVVIQWNDTKTTYSVVNYNYVATSLPIIGLDPDLEVLVKRTPYAMPDYDPRLKNLLVSQSVSTAFDETYTENRMWLTTYSLIDQDVISKNESVDEAENDANYKVFPTCKQFKYMVLALAIIDRKSSGLTITTKQQAILDKLQAKAAKIWNNHLIGAAKKSAIAASEEVDLDADWETIDPED